jgi:hypothetical protein
VTKSEMDTVRRIVREEIAAAFGRVAEIARQNIHSSDMQAVAYAAIRDAMTEEKETMEESPDGA